MARRHTHFWLMTIQTDRGVVGVQGTTRLRRGETRELLFQRLRALVDAEQPDATGGAVTWFDVQRNRL